MQPFKGLAVSRAQLEKAIKANTLAALAEDIESGDITAALIPADKKIAARVITREPAVVCGQPWVNAVFSTLDAQYNTNTTITWHKNEGEQASTDDTLFEISGNARTLLTGERTALNFLQTLSATATIAKRYSESVKDSAITVLDTRKTIPGLRIAQKYAVAVGGCHNHRIGLWDAFLIKENHIAACGSLSAAIAQARSMAPNTPVQVEVENHQELQQALAAKADIIMLDNFSRDDTLAILGTPTPSSVFEVSGNIDFDNFQPLPSCQNYRISVGALTKHIKAIDLSFRVIN